LKLPNRVDPKLVLVGLVQEFLSLIQNISNIRNPNVIISAEVRGVVVLLQELLHELPNDPAILWSFGEMTAGLERGHG
jgi:hypothetical protein